MYIVTTEDLYKAVLSLINKESTRSMTPSEFNEWINRAQLDYVKVRYMEYDMHQKRMDDLRQIIVRTDGTGLNPDPILNTGNNIAGEELFAIPTDISDSQYGKYMFLLNVAFKIIYQGNKCFTDGTESDWMKAKPLPADVETEFNYYNKPNDERLYYQQIVNAVRPMKGSSSYMSQARLMYLRYPREIQFIDGGTNIEPEFEPRINMEIAKICARGYLESIESKRHQTFIGEENLNFN
jgi:hypothetical protein